jgi:hypothetical protein
MLFRIFAEFVWSDAGFVASGWDDYEILVRSNSKKNAAKKVWKWAKEKGAVQKHLQFVDEKMWKRDKSYKTTKVK